MPAFSPTFMIPNQNVIIPTKPSESSAPVFALSKIPFITSENINCPEEVEFYKDSSVVFPGINTFSVNNKWILKNDSIFISRDVSSADTAQISGVESGLFYTGAYKLDLKGKHLKMQSSDITIICR